MKPNLRTIKTARTLEAINNAAQNGFWPLVKPVTPSPRIRSKFAVLQNKNTGAIEVIADYRADRSADSFNKIIDFTFYYPYHFPNPYAAYLIPKDLQVGERVWLEDLIEDVIGTSWNQGDTHRMANCEALWNGSEFILKHEPTNGSTAIG